MDLSLETQIRDLAETYGPEAVWQNALVLIQTRYKQSAGEAESNVFLSDVEAMENRGGVEKIKFTVYRGRGLGALIMLLAIVTGLLVMLHKEVLLCSFGP